ncbi:unnamed protein product [Mycena citricolor]|uniref:NADAR domain-containing protein n=1 Tax=Mycena citricolor TaxID=2018698 RepID=A0AAD2HDY9_9AGAR|nr:unnamed protein product [Mycena citricolor]CAK5273922.1 unnamed protein product [Mycena citricolor]
MGSSSSKSRTRAYPLVNPAIHVPYGHNPNAYVNAHFHPNVPPNSKKKRKRNRKESRREGNARAFVEGWHIGNGGIPGIQPQLVPPVSQPTGTSAPDNAASTLMPQAQPEFAAPVNSIAPDPAAVSQPTLAAVGPDMARVLEPLPPANPEVYGPPSQPTFRLLDNPLPTPPRDLYELSPYNTLLDLPHTRALFTTTHSQQSPISMPANGSYGRRNGGRAGGILRAMMGRRKEDQIQLVPVFMQAAPAQTTMPQPAQHRATPALLQPLATPHSAQTAAPGLLPTAAPDTVIRFPNENPEFLGFLSYSPHHVIDADGSRYPTVMHLYEAQKFLPLYPQLAKRIQACSDVTQLHDVDNELTATHPHAVRSDWSVVFLQAMEDAVRRKFQLHANLLDLLLRTGTLPLVYAGGADTFWGEGLDGQGLNQLGLLMQRVRESLRSESGIPG